MALGLALLANTRPYEGLVLAAAVAIAIVAWVIGPLRPNLPTVFSRVLTPMALILATGKVAPAATLPVTLIMLEAVRDYLADAGRKVGVKPAGGIRTTKDAIKYLVMVNETVGEGWLDPDWFRFGASTLLNDLLMQYVKTQTGCYGRAEDFSRE